MTLAEYQALLRSYQDSQAKYQNDNGAAWADISGTATDADRAAMANNARESDRTYRAWLGTLPDGGADYNSQVNANFAAKQKRNRLAFAASAAAIGGIGALGAAGSGAGGVGGSLGAAESGAYGAGSGWGADTLGAMGLGGSGSVGGLGAAGGGIVDSWLPGISNMDLIKMGGSLVGSLIQNKGVTDANKAAMAGTQAALDETRRQADRTYADYAPYRAAGVNALSQLQGDINRPVTAAEVMSDPGYQFGQQQGQQAIDRRIAASGGRVSGQAIKAAARFGTDYATTGYGAAYQRRQDRLNRLAALAGIGQTATGGSALAGANASNNIAGMQVNQGETTAGSKLAQGNIWGNTANQLAALYGRPTWQQGG